MDTARSSDQIPVDLRRAGRPARHVQEKGVATYDPSYPGGGTGHRRRPRCRRRAAAAAKKNEIVIKGDFKWRTGKGVTDTQRFSPRTVSVKSGATVTVRNKSKAPDPHTITFIENSLIPDGFESPIVGTTFAAHQPGGEEAPPIIKLDDGVAAATRTRRSRSTPSARSRRPVTPSSWRPARSPRSSW